MTVGGVGTTCGPASPTWGGVPLTGDAVPGGEATIWAEAVRGSRVSRRPARVVAALHIGL